MKVAAIVGPTASGKTALSLEIARRLDAEIVSLDSMQLYRGMDIGTDKASPEARVEITHHLIDVFEPQVDVSVAQFQKIARAAIEDIWSRGRLPLLVGGSGLYFRAVVDDLRFQPRSAARRADLEMELEREGPDALYARLERLDPAAAAKIDPGNARRTIRALEVIEITGEPFSANVTWDGYESIYELVVAGLERDRSELYHRIESRVRAMVDRGLLDEAEALAERGLSTTARQALGYRQVLENPHGSHDALVSAISKATKRFARRQLSWFKADPRVNWFDASDSELTQQVAAFFTERLAFEP